MGDSTGILYAQLAGNCVAIGSSTIIFFLVSCFGPQKDDWDLMNKSIKLVGGDGGENAKVLGEDWESSPEFLLSAKHWILQYGVGWSRFLTCDAKAADTITVTGAEGTEKTASA